MAVLHMTEAELARDLHEVLEKVRNGMEVVIEQNSHPIAIIKSAPVKGRKASEIIAALEAAGADAIIDEDFARDVEEGTRPTASHGILHPVHPVTADTAEIIARISGQQAAKGVKIPLADELGYAVGTANSRDFSRIPELQIVTL